MKLQIIRPFKFAHRGTDVRSYEPGPVETDDAELVEVALQEGWGVTEEPITEKALGGAPDNKAFPGAPMVAGKPGRRGRKRAKPEES